MTKWADYLISAVRYNEAGTHIDKVLAHPDNDQTVGGGVERARQTVVNHLDDDVTYATIYRDSDDKWAYGAEVGIVTIRGTKYIRTYSDQIEADNLGDLPTF